MPFAMRVIAVGMILASASFSEAPRNLKCIRGDAACVIAAIEEANNKDGDTVLFLGRGVYTLDSATSPSLLPDGLTSTGRLTIKGAGADTTIIQRAADAAPFRPSSPEVAREYSGTSSPEVTISAVDGAARQG